MTYFPNSFSHRVVMMITIRTVSNCILFSAGHQTARDTVGNGVLAMMREPRSGSLGSEPSRITCRCGGVVAFRRGCSKLGGGFEDTEIGYPIAEEKRYFLYLSLQPRPPGSDDPDNFRITRANNVPLPSVWVLSLHGFRPCPNGSLNYP